MNDDIERCPRCKSLDLTICNDDGLECDECGLWFDTDDDCNLLWAYILHPAQWHPS